MLKVAVCVKQVPKEKVSMNRSDGNLNRSEAEGSMNIYDYAALETGLRIREQEGGTVDVFTMGPPGAQAVLKEALSYGADRAVLLCDPGFAGADVLATSYTLACGIRAEETYDVVLCGLKTTDGDTSQVGGELAAHLGITYVPGVCRLEEINDASVRAAFLTDHKKIRIETGLPVLLSVEPSVFPVRIPSLSERLKSRKKEISRWDSQRIQADPKRIGKIGSATKVTGLRTVRKGNQTKQLDVTAAEAVKYIEDRADLWIKSS